MKKIELAVFDMAGTTVNEDNVVYKTVRAALGRSCRMAPHISDGQTPSPPAAAVLALVVRPDTWAHIACHLAVDELWRARRVSRHFRSACEDTIARLRQLSLECYGSNVTDEGLRAVAAACTQLTSLSLNGCVKVTDEGVCAVKDHSLSKCKVSFQKSYYY